MYLHISNICINLVEQLRDITNLEVAHDTDKVHRTMNNEARLMEAIWAFLFWQSARPTDMVKISADGFDYDVTLIIDEGTEVAKKLESEMKEKCRFLHDTYINVLEDCNAQAIHFIWEKEG